MVDPKHSARMAGLRYVNSDIPGFQRKRTDQGFVYLDLQGQPIEDPEILARIRSLVLPPAWENVWICPTPHGHLQATGVDARGRKQYRYHPQYRQVRNETKFSRIPEFARALPEIRSRVERDIRAPGLRREKVLATIVRLLETTFIRIGNEEYAKENSSFGLTTLRARHVKIEGSRMQFHFRGKSGKMHEITVEDRRLAHIVRNCRDLPGYELFHYTDESKEVHSIGSSDVNSYLRELSGADFTAKDFRTWAGTVQTALALADIGIAETETQAKRNIVEAVKQTAERLGNRPATCRKYYVHPLILDAYMNGMVVEPESDDPLAPSGAQPADLHSVGLHPEEKSVVTLLEKATESEAAQRAARSPGWPSRRSGSGHTKEETPRPTLRQAL